MSGEQLERSILERKEREELKAIATAMSLEPVARTKKADLVDQILRAAGVEVSQGATPNGSLIGTSASARRAAPGSGPAVTAAAPATAAGGSEAGGDASAGPADETPNGKAPRGRPARSRAAKVKADPPDDAALAADSHESPAGEAQATSDSDPGRHGAESTGADHQHASPDAGDGEGTEASRPAEEGTTARRQPRRSAAATKRAAGANGTGSSAGGSAGSNAAGSNAAASHAATSNGTGSLTEAPAANHSPAAEAGTQPMASSDRGPDSGHVPGSTTTDAPSNGAESPATAGGDRSGQSNTPGSYAPSQQRPQRQQADRQQGHNQGNQGQGNQAQGNSSQGNQGQGNQQGDAGNRRGRRRRGRERERGGELQGAGQPDSNWQGELVPVKGLVDLRDEGYGFLRTSGYLASSKDVYVSVNQARRFALRRGDALEGACRPAGPSEKYPALLRIDTINGMTPDEARERPRFEDLTPLFPDERLRLESSSDPSNVTARTIDLISPIGKGQRGMIVSPSKAGKTTIMKQIAHSVELNNPDVHLMVLLVDERPEEVTDMRRSVKGEVIASTFDRPADEHTALSELTMERAKRLVEMGQDVVIILDGITRLARAYNLAQPATGRIMSGGVDSGALYPPKKFFGAARNVEEGGSLTILATALIETGSKMDEVIFEEFKGTGNMELRLDRKLAERRIYPAIDVNASSTRHEELLFDRSQLQQVWKLRRVLNALGAEGSAAAGLELLMDKIKTTRSNDEFLAEIAKAPTPSN